MWQFAQINIVSTRLAMAGRLLSLNPFQGFIPPYNSFDPRKAECNNVVIYFYYLDSYSRLVWFERSPYYFEWI